MYLSIFKQGYNRDGEQYCHGKFLVVFDHPDTKTSAKLVNCGA